MKNMKLFKSIQDFEGYINAITEKYYIKTKSGKEIEVSKEDSEYSKEITERIYDYKEKYRLFFEYIKQTVTNYKNNRNQFLELLTSKEYIKEYTAFKSVCKITKINPFKTFPTIVKQYFGLNHRLNKAYRSWLNCIWKDCQNEKEIVEYVENCLNRKHKK